MKLTLPFINRPQVGEPERNAEVENVKNCNIDKSHPV